MWVLGKVLFDLDSTGITKKLLMKTKYNPETGKQIGICWLCEHVVAISWVQVLVFGSGQEV